MFWLGYFLKKRVQDENYQRVLAMNKGELDKWLVENELKSLYFINRAKQTKRNYYMGSNLKQTQEDEVLKSIIKEQLRTYVVEDTVHVQTFFQKTGSNQEDF